ncbi:MAG TPA: M48 family metallopeptidase [Arenimonas sp.]|nr:M48 family metallopeptidase [Arenimonas sp.]
MIGRAVLLALLLSTPPLASAIDSARAGQRPPSGSDEDELWYAMERAEQELQQSPRRIRDVALNAYVGGVACKVVDDFCSDVRVYLIDQPGFNASMSPNGMLVVWSGALLRLRDEAELALLIGHEFAHFRERHSLKQWRKAKRTTAFMATFGVASYGGGVGAAGALAGMAGSASLLRHSRSAEREADRIGFAAAVAEGYDSGAGIRLWQRLLAEEETVRRGKPAPVFASHPDTAARLADVQRAAHLHGGMGKRGVHAYREATAAFLPDWLEGELSRRRFDASIEAIGRLRDDYGDAQRGLLTHFLAEAHRRRARDGDLALAAALYAEATTLADAPAAAFREQALIQRAAGERDAAITNFRRYLQLEPAADDAAFIAAYLQELASPP